MLIKISSGLKKIKLKLALAAVVFSFCFFLPAVSAINAEENNDSNLVLTPTPSAVEQSAAFGAEDSLVRLRKDREDFKNNKLEESKEKTNVSKEKNSIKKKEIQARLEKIKQEKEAKRKAVLVRLIDIQIKQLKSTKDRVAKMTNIAVDLKTSLNTKIDEAISELEADKIVLEKITVPEDLKKFAKELNDSIKSKREIIKMITDAILASRTEKTIIAAEAKLSKITAKIAELKLSGQNTVELDNLLAAAKEKIAAANTKIGKKELKEAVNELKEAYEDMKKVLEKTKEKLPAVSSPVLTPPAISMPPVSFECPAEKFINCMPIALQPGETPSIERENLCSGEYHQWIRANCLDVEFAY